jgi:hypothetical protein
MNARQFYNLVVRMRKAQRDCDSKPSAYNKAMRTELERQVDAEIERVTKIEQAQAENQQTKLL